MKIRIVLFLILQCTLLFGQKELYVIFKANNLSGATKATLISGKTTAVYEEGLIEEVNRGELAPNSFSVGGVGHSKIYKNLEHPDIVKIQLFKEDDYFTFADKDYFITDSIPQLKWKINESDKTLEIQGYKCKEAFVEFRGSQFKAYYTPEIPTSFGPWKFHGLPGLILKISSLNNPSISWEAEKVIYPYNSDKEEDNRARGVALTMKEYIQQKDELIDNRGKAYSAKTGSAYHPIPNHIRRDKSRERKYEWETW